jgi:gliding motility-associated-like protein
MKKICYIRIVLFVFVLLFWSASKSFATHERAGEITYRCLGGYQYEITVTTYTKASSCPADRCDLTVYISNSTGVIDSVKVYRTNGPVCSAAEPSYSCNGSIANPNCSHCGVLLQPPSLDVKVNTYTAVYTFPGPYTYIISMTDPNRNDNIVNVGSGVPFSIQDTIVISPWIIPCNSSPVLVNPPIDRACAGKLFVHNPGAVDPDGDSLSYKLGICFRDLNTPISGYWIPSGVSVNPITGDFIWNVPPSASSYDCDEYNFAIDIEEWRKFADGQYHKIGTVRRDMQVKVCNCQNEPPVIADVKDTCILANTSLTFTVTASDPGNNFIVSFTATGGPFNTTPAATFTSDAPIQSPSTGIFSWTPSCEQVRKNPYIVTLKATDDGAPDYPPLPLSDYETFFIKVIAPAPQNLTAVPYCTTMKLSWDAALCNPQNNKLLGYRIYRKIGCDTLNPNYCVTGVPSSWGYSLIATVSYTATTTYTDNNGGNGLVHGFVYSYRVVAYYWDGAESYPSNPVCAKLVRDVPIITNVDVLSTSASNGKIEVKWLKPLATEFDTTQPGNQGPYRFDLLRATGNNNPTTVIQTFSSPYFATLNTTSYIDTGLNTEATSFTYRVDFYSASNISCPAKNASSVFISCTPADNKITLTWNEQVPWMNYKYDIYRFGGDSPNWNFIGTTTLQTFTDSNLANGTQYCYKVKSIGAYPDPSLPAPLLNWSQELCCVPVDLVPPCPVTLAVDSSCILSQNILTWNNPNNSCSDDALYYIIYYTPVENGILSVLDTIFDINTTIFIHDSLNSIAGCYAVTSVDSFANESALSNIICVDNCSFYELPNVFTPNGDGLNDFFTPIHPYKYVKDIDIKIYDRWGIEVFRTTNPEILWDGKSSQTGRMASDGVYYYACIVNEIRLKGIIPRILTGNVHLLKGETKTEGGGGK